MSVINKMLQELDQRQATTKPEGQTAHSVRAARDVARKDKEAFWRVLVLLMLASVAWVAWLAYQLQIQPVVTTLAFKAAEDARSRRGLHAPEAVVEKAPVAVQPAAPPAASLPAPETSPTATPDMLRLAPMIETPITSTGARKPAAVGTPRPAPAESQALAAPQRDPAKSRDDAGSARSAGAATPPPSAPASRVEKRDRVRTPQERAEADFRRAAGLLNEGRISEAQDALGAALEQDRNHAAARQALVALLLEQRQVEQARLLLQEGLAISPEQAVFASVLARILVEAKDYEGALNTLQGAMQRGTHNADFLSLLGAVYQRLGRYSEAADAYRGALQLSPTGSSWVGLGISLEAAQRRPEAAEAFRRALASNTLGAELRAFAESRIRQLQ